MAQVHIEISDEEHERFLQQAEQDGITLSEWMKNAARKRCNERQVQEERRVHEPFASRKPFKSVEELEAFFRYCDTLEGPEREPDWEDHLEVINKGKMSGWADT